MFVCMHVLRGSSIPLLVVTLWLFILGGVILILFLDVWLDARTFQIATACCLGIYFSLLFL